MFALVLSCWPESHLPWIWYPPINFLSQCYKGYLTKGLLVFQNVDERKESSIYPPSSSPPHHCQNPFVNISQHSLKNYSKIYKF